MLNNYSPRDVLLHLSRIFKMEVNGKWITSEIPRKSRLLMEKWWLNGTYFLADGDSEPHLEGVKYLLR
ncbi:MAG: hypothetical protein JRM98_01525, partial [Nitrososphaerota archaeon]|nr:hypothetical protein [Nitrososphaerota archaeon]